MSSQRRAFLVIGLAFGDCGKGSIVDFLVRRYDARTVVRFNGGPQAGHNVVTSDGRRHTFSQFGSGTFVPGVHTLLSRFMLIEPYALYNEAAHLAEIGVADAIERLSIDARCPIITPFHQAANRLRELARGDASHGTCGMGVGETMLDLRDAPDLVLRAGSLCDRATITRTLLKIRDRKMDELGDTIESLQSHPRARFSVETFRDPSWIESAVAKYDSLGRTATLVDDKGVRRLLGIDGTIVFEGAQGVLLDEDFGFHPHTTWSKTTFANADSLIDEASDSGHCTRIGVLRTYFTRHGSGPLVSENNAMRTALPEADNINDGWQGRFRVGVFDAVAARYALSVAEAVDCLAITHVDRTRLLPSRICNAYSADGSAMREIPRLKPDDFPARERLTAQLRRCSPRHSELPSTNEREWLATIANELCTPIGITSHGPTAEEKETLSHSL